MAIPDYQSIMLPLLQLVENKEEISLKDAVNELTVHFKLTEDEKKQLNPNSRQTTFYNRVTWAKLYLKQALLIEFPNRGSFKITDAGLNILKMKPEKIDRAFLVKNTKFNLSNSTNLSNSASNTTSDSGETPDEKIGKAAQDLKVALKSELLQMIMECSPKFFEQLVVDVLLKMGYGGTREDAGEIIGKSGDEGIDGIIKEDRLGLEEIYIQAKRWQGNVGRPQIQTFAGALQGKRAKKGIFITTSAFTKEAENFVSKIDSKIILIDGITLAHLMIEYNVGVSTVDVYEIKKIDSDYFSDDL